MRPWSTAMIAAAEANLVSRRFLLAIDTVEGWLRCTDHSYALVYAGETYEAGVDHWKIDGTLASGSQLVPEPVTISFDGAEQYDDTSFIGRLVDRTWHRRDIYLTGIVINPQTGALLDDFDTWRGRLDTLNVTDQVGGVSTAALRCESGTFHALSRNNATASDADQKRRNANDTFFENQALKVSQKMPFGLSYSDIPGTPNTSGGGNSGGGFNGF